MKIFAIMMILLSAISCSQKSDNSTPARFDEAKLGELASQFCKSGERLVELDLNATPVQFQYLRDYARIFAFMNGSGRCALERNIDDSWVSGWFTVHINSDCLLNGSFWTVYATTDDGGVQSYQLKSEDPPNLPNIYLGGPPTMDATYARDHAGLRLLKCASQPSDSRQ